MTRELTSCLTKTSAAYLRDALGAINRDSFNRHYPEATSGLEALQIAFDWQAGQNEDHLRLWLRTEKKQAAEIEARNTQFRAFVDEIAGREFEDNATWPESPEWTKHFPEHPTARGVPPAPFPEDMKLKTGSFEHCLAWSDFNIQRMKQHRLVLDICARILMDSHAFKHLEAPLARAKNWSWNKTGQLEATRMQLIVLEGDPAKIQALREESLRDVRAENRSVHHFYSHFNDQGAGGTDGDKRFRSEALRRVQAGLDTGAATDPSYSDLGLG